MFRSTFRSLRHSRFRLYFAGQMVSLTGTWMQHVAQAWLVYRLTGSGVMLGVTAFAGNLPVLLFGLFGGVLADRWPRRRLLLAVHTVAVAQALLLALLTLGGWVVVWHIIALAFLLGCANAVEMPARHGLLAELVSREELPNAIALNSGVFSFARFLGPALAGVLVAIVGEGPVFLLNAASFAAVLAALWVMGPLGKARGDEGSPTRLRAAFAFVRERVVLIMALLLVLMVSLFGVPYAILMPLFADRVLGGQADTLGWLLGAAGAGAFMGALYLARRQGVSGLRRLAGVAGIAAGSALLLLSYQETLPSALALLPVAGMGFTLLVAASNTVIQLHTPDELRGRVMALFSIAFIGMLPLGNLAAGMLGEWLGVPWALRFYGLICVGGAFVYLAVARRILPPQAVMGRATRDR